MPPCFRVRARIITKDSLMKTVFSLFTVIALMLGSLLLAPEPAGAETVSFPLQIDYPFIRSLVVQTAFTDSGQRMVITDPENDCQQIALSDPIFAGEKNLLRIDVAVHLRGGTLMGENCLFPMEWDGFLVAHLKPRVLPGKWQLFFDPVDSVLLDRHRRPDRFMGTLWDLFKAPVMARMRNIRIAVSEPITELKPFLLSAVPAADQPHVEAMLESLRPGEIFSGPEAIHIEMLADVGAVSTVAEEPPPAPLTPDEIDAFISVWETWDAFLVHALMSLSGASLTDEERDILLNVLLDTRYRFIAELEADTHASSGDFVREQFLDAWKKLSPVLKKRLTGHPTDNSWACLAFFTATDALAALDRLGPLFNIEISKNGFIRLARMLSENKDVTLEYSQALDPELRKLLGMDRFREIPGQGPDAIDNDEKAPGSEMSLETGGPQAILHFRQSMISGVCRVFTPNVCWAGKSWIHPTLKELRTWMVSRENVKTHLQKIKPLLEAATRENLQKNHIPVSYHEMFQKAVYATAWQESCFRQFIVDKQKLTYIRSYNNSSVGMMQINERVWRGMYHIERLRWDIAYNAAAGVDILNLYLRKYAIPKRASLTGRDVLDSDGMACALYAMYNAGPGGFSGYLNRRRTGKLSKIDAHFKEKYTWVQNGQWDKLGNCY